MLICIEGVYRNARMDLTESPGETRDETPVIVTFLPPGVVDLRQAGIDETQGAELRARLASFASEWDRPEMDSYDNYDAARPAG